MDLASIRPPVIHTKNFPMYLADLVIMRMDRDESIVSISPPK
ncbi:hypothetical protein SAMN05192573_1353 [Mucilaginibacter gossypii]|uniref:Uncharacterized protein n=1 Tax=Mucilaginibacter gossypii TaxID=551996 RepID=A0A1G8NP44_9SPHI|nr:hypothetical protein SAMN05192573_1353 [Mucilaginibacter gossypii]